MHISIKAYIGLVAFAVAGTVLTFVTNLDPGPIAPVSSLLIILVGSWCVFRAAAQTIGYARAAAGLVTILIVGLVSEIAGLYTGFPFGTYRYTSEWAPTIPLPGGQLFPIALPFAWTMVVGSASLVAHGFFKRLSPGPKWVGVAFAAFLATAVDFAMEPVTVDALNYWKWQDPTHIFSAPWSNAVGWLTVSSVGSALLTSSLVTSKKADESRTGLVVLAGHLALMTVVALTHLNKGNTRMTIAGVLAIAVCWAGLEVVSIWRCSKVLDE